MEAGPVPDSGTAAEAPPPAPAVEVLSATGQQPSVARLTVEQKQGIKREVEGEQQKVVLRVQVATKGQARLLTWSVIVLNTIFVMLSFALLGGEAALRTLGDMRTLYKAQLVLGCICLGLLGCILIWLGGSVRTTLRERRAWSARQRYFAATAATLLCTVFAFSAISVAGLADTLHQPDCSYPWVALAVLEFLRRLSYSFALFYLLVRLSNMRLYRGGGALDMDPDHLLLVDRPWADQARSNLFIFSVWTLMVACLGINLAGRLRLHKSGARDSISGCATQISQLPCTAPPLQAVSAAVSFGANLLFVIWWWLLAKRALQDHKQLPFCRYRPTHIFVRTCARVLGPVQVAVLLSVLLLELVPALRGNCMSAVSAQLGSLPVELSLTVASVVFAILYMPKGSEVDSPLLQEFLQAFSWTQAEIPADLERRNQQLLASEVVPKKAVGQSDLGAQVEGAADYLPGVLRLGLGKLAHVQDMGSALAQLKQEPIFCFETACRLYYWARLAYRDDESYKYLNPATALTLFDLEQWVRLDEDESDTHVFIGWSSTRVVLAFRGTASKDNTITDLKAWGVTYTPEPSWGGRRVGTHAGFLKAWLAGGFNERVLAQLRAVEAERPAGGAPLRIWITGHSLGGALAVLASQQIQRQHPDCRMTLYTWGCPRVGNHNFARMFREAVPDAWAIVNRGDPVTIIPKWGFKRVGQRVNVDGDGNIIVRGTYFELSVVHRGMVINNHMMGQYGLALSSIMKSQFSASKSMPGGARGVQALLQSLNVGTALVMTHLDLGSLQDPSKLPALTEKLDATLVVAGTSGTLQGVASSGKEVGSGWSQGKEVGSGEAEVAGKEAVCVSMKGAS